MERKVLGLALPPVAVREERYSGDAKFLFLLEPLVDSLSASLQEFQLQSETISTLFEALKKDLETTLFHPSIKIPVVQVPNFRFSLFLVDYPTLPLYVKRRFDVTVKVKPKTDHDPVPLPLFCALSIHQMTPASEEIHFSRLGTPHIGTSLLKGQTTLMFHSPQATFKKVVFDDISQRFPQGRVNFVVRCVSREDVQPLVVEGVRVKARKKRRDEVI